MAKKKVLESGWTLFAAVLIVGPFALPLLWRNPTLGRPVKIGISIAVCALSAALIFTTGWITQQLALTLTEF